MRLIKSRRKRIRFRNFLTHRRRFESSYISRHDPKPETSKYLIKYLLMGASFFFLFYSRTIIFTVVCT